jgi:hypothetical protein
MEIDAQEYQHGDLESRHIVDVVILERGCLDQRKMLPKSRTDPQFSATCAAVSKGLDSFCIEVMSSEAVFPSTKKNRLFDCVEKLICDNIEQVVQDVESETVNTDFLEQLYLLMLSSTRHEGQPPNSRWVRVYADRMSPKFFKTLQYFTSHDYYDSIQDYQPWDVAEDSSLSEVSNEYERLYWYGLSPRIASDRALGIMISELKNLEDKVEPDQGAMASYLSTVFQYALQYNHVVLIRIFHDI